MVETCMIRLWKVGAEEIEIVMSDISRTVFVREVHAVGV
jgi:hypothetical protein